MKNLNLVTVSLITVLIIGTMTGCSKKAEPAPTPNPCQSVICQNGGVCTNGSCLCSTGYEGTNCTTKSNAKFVGTYIGTANCAGSTTSETIPVEALADPQSIKIYLNSEHVLTANISGNSISIPVQNFPSGVTNYRYSGSGTLTSNALSLTISVLYTSASGDDPYTCVFTISK